jgi:Protein of unknown function (DUF1573)
MKPTKAFAALALALLLAVAGLAQGNSPANQTGPAPKMMIESPTHDFGEIKAGTPLRYAFKIKNEGKGELKILSVAPS